MSTVCIIQARMGSTRLPGKVLEELLGKPVLWWDMHRVSKCKLIDSIVIATSTFERDDAIASLCEKHFWNCFRGSEDDLLDRYYQCAVKFSATTVVRITSDCPLIEPAVSDLVVEKYNELSPNIDYVSNFQVQSYPIGFATEVMSFDALERAWNEDKNPQWREHVTPFIYQHPEKFRLAGVEHECDLSHYRVTLDTPEDYQLLSRIYDHFGHGDFSWNDWMSLLEQRPELYELNRQIKQKGL